MNLRLFIFTLLMAPAYCVEVLLVGTAEAGLGFERATALKPLHARFDIPFAKAKSLSFAEAQSLSAAEAQSLTAADLAARKRAILRGSAPPLSTQGAPPYQPGNVSELS